MAPVAGPRWRAWPSLNPRIQVAFGGRRGRSPAHPCERHPSGGSTPERIGPASEQPFPSCRIKRGRVILLPVESRGERDSPVFPRSQSRNWGGPRFLDRLPPKDLRHDRNHPRRPARNAGHAHPPGPGPRSHARMGNQRADPTAIRRCPSGNAGFSVSSPSPPGETGPSQVLVGHFEKQPARQVLPAHRCRKKGAGK